MATRSTQCSTAHRDPAQMVISGQEAFPVQNFVLESTKNFTLARGQKLARPILIAPHARDHLSEQYSPCAAQPNILSSKSLRPLQPMETSARAEHQERSPGLSRAGADPSSPRTAKTCSRFRSRANNSQSLSVTSQLSSEEPVTSAEIELILAFLRNELDTIFKGDS